MPHDQPTRGPGRRFTKLTLRAKRGGSQFDLFRTTVFHCSNAFFGSVGELVLVVIQSELPGGSAPDRIAVYFN